MLLRLRYYCLAFVTLWSATSLDTKAANAQAFQVSSAYWPIAKADGANSTTGTALFATKTASGSYSGYPASFFYSVTGEAQRSNASADYTNNPSVSSEANFQCAPSAPSSGHSSQGIAEMSVNTNWPAPSHIRAVLTIHSRINQTDSGGYVDGYTAARVGNHELIWKKNSSGSGYSTRLSVYGRSTGSSISTGANADETVVIFLPAGGAWMKVDSFLDAKIAGNAEASASVSLTAVDDIPDSMGPDAHTMEIFPLPEPPDWGEVEDWPTVFVLDPP